MIKASIFLLVVAALLSMHSAFSALSYEPKDNGNIHTFFDSLRNQTAVSDMAAIRMSVRVEIAETELHEINMLTGLAAAQQQAAPRYRKSGPPDSTQVNQPLIGGILSK